MDCVTRHRYLFHTHKAHTLTHSLTGLIQTQADIDVVIVVLYVKSCLFFGFVQHEAEEEEEVLMTAYNK